MEVQSFENDEPKDSDKGALQPWRAFLHVLRSKPEISNPQKLQKTLFNLIFFRVLIVLCLLASTLWNVLATAQSDTKAMLIYFSMAITVMVSLINALWLRKGRQLWFLGYSQLCFDVLLATVVIFITGGGVSPFIFLYFLAILEAAVIFGRHGAVTIGAFSGLSYGLIVSGLLPALDQNEAPATSHQILGAYVALVVIALLSSYLAKQLESAGRMAQSFAKDLSDLANQQQQLFDDISEGIITVDLSEMVTNINQAACAIMGLADSEAENIVGISFSTIFKQCGVRNPERLLATEDDIASTELSLEKASTSTPLHISYNVRPIINSEGKQTGSMFIFSDISHLRNMEELLTLHEQMTKLLVKGDESSDIIKDGVGGLRMIGESTMMRQIYALVERVAASDASVLITGESGTGKELVAKAIHLRGPRKDRPFVTINCGAIPENLIESELFGHKKGSFTGAVRDNPGLFKQATGGTIFLDEIGEIPLHLQTKLLRVLQERTVRAVGDVYDLPIDVRVIAATNRELKEEIRNGRFREDLFYRLNVVNIVLPPLRTRKEDIPHLVRYFIGKYVNPSEPLAQVSPEALQLLMGYSFPGNIRELENILERAIVLGGGAILPEHLPPELLNISANGKGAFINGDSQAEFHNLPLDLEGELAKIERHYLFQALDEAGGIKKQAAKLLGLNFRSFRYRLKKYGVSEPDHVE